MLPLFPSSSWLLLRFYRLPVSPESRISSRKPSNGEKLPNRHSSITTVIAAQDLSLNEFPFHYKKLLHERFHLTASLPSVRFGLIPSDGLILSGNGACAHTHSFPYGHRACSCPRHYSDPNASWGWDIRLYTPVLRGTVE